MARRRKDKSVKDVAGREGGMSSVRAVDRAIAILQSFTAEQPAMSVIEIQRRVGLSRPTLYRLLHTLALKGLIRAEGEPQRFKLAHGVMQLAHVWLRGLDAVGVARPILERLRDQTGETAALFALQEDRGICILECASHHVLAISRGVGHAVQVTQGATGKAILGHLQPAQQREFLDKLARAQRTQLEDALAEARRSGYATSRGEIFVGAVAVAAPYFDHRGQVIGSVGLYGPTARVSDDRLREFARLVVDAAREISSLLGYQNTSDRSEVTTDKQRSAAPTQARSAKARAR